MDTREMRRRLVDLFKQNPNSKGTRGGDSKHPAATEPQLDVSDPMLIFWKFRFRKEWVVDSDGTKYYCWLAVVSLVALYNIIVVPMRSVFSELDDSYYRVAFSLFDYLGDVVNMIDLVVSMLVGYLGEELLTVHDPRLLANHWLDTSGKLDLLSIIPTDLAYIWTGIHHPFPLLRFNRLLKYPKLANFLKKSEGRVSHPQNMRLFALMMKFFILIHFNACLYYFLSEQSGLNSDGWVYPGEAGWRKAGEGETNANDTLLQKFTWSFYWSFHTLTMIGITKQPETEWQFLLLTADFVLGVMLFSQVLANTMHTVLHSTLQARKFRKRIDEVVEYMNMRNVTGELRNKVLEYFQYQWINHRLVDDKDALRCLPERIEAELMMAVHLETLKHVRIFQGVEPGLLVDLVLKLRLQVFAAGEYVCRKGDVGKDLFIIKKGCLEVVSDDGALVFVRLGEGSVFGEISLLNIAGIKSGTRRTANVRSVGYSDLFALSKHDLWEALEGYSEGKSKILEIGRQILIKDNLIDLSQEADFNQRQQLLLDKIMKCTTGVNYLQTNLGSLISERAAGVYRMKQRMAKLEKAIKLQDRIDTQRAQMWEIEKVKQKDMKMRLEEEARVKAEEDKTKAEEEAKVAAEEARIWAEYRRATEEAKAVEDERRRKLEKGAKMKRMKQGIFKEEDSDEENDVLVKLFELTEQDLERLRWRKEFKEKSLGDVITEGSFPEHVNYFPVESYLPPSWKTVAEIRYESDLSYLTNTSSYFEPLNFVPKEFTAPE